MLPSSARSGALLNACRNPREPYEMVSPGTRDSSPASGDWAANFAPPPPASQRSAAPTTNNLKLAVHGRRRLLLGRSAARPVEN